MYLYMSTDFHAQRLVVMKTYTSWVGQMMNDHSLWDLVCANSANYTGIVTGLALGFPYIQQSQIFWAKKKKHDQPIGRARPQRFLDQLLRNLLSTSDTGRRTKISGCQLRTSNGQTTTRLVKVIFYYNCFKNWGQLHEDEGRMLWCPIFEPQDVQHPVSSCTTRLLPSPTFWPHRSA